MALLEVENLQTHFRTPEGINRAVDGVSFSVGSGETLAIVGESGCGKSVTAMSILRLIAQPPGKIAGRIRFQGRDLLKLGKAEMREIRGNDISMIFQEPMTSLNPVLTIGRQIGETLMLHQGLSRADGDRRTVEMLRLVGIPAPERRVDDYPHELSGGMRQRVMIAMALACNPKLLIADEPTTALDVTVQAQILDLLRQDLQSRLQHRDHRDHPRPRRRRRDGRACRRHVCGQEGRGGSGKGPVREPAPSLHAGAAGFDPAREARAAPDVGAAAPGRDPGRRAVAQVAHPWMPVRASLQHGDGALPRRRPGLRGEGAGPLRRLLVCAARGRSAATDVSPSRPCSRFAA